jgi:Predicted transcriptional regulators
LKARGNGWECAAFINKHISICLIIDGGENVEWDALADCFKALGDKTRLRILALLKVEERCVCELVDMLGMTQSAVSQHLRRLKQAKLVKERRSGQWVFYSLDGSMYPFFEDVVRMLPDLREEVERFKQRGRNVVCE